MLRTILTILVPFLTPFLCYYVWVWFQNRKKEREETGEPLQAWQTFPWAKLIISGSVLAIGALVFLFMQKDPLPEGRWVPAKIVDGEIVPGHFEPIPEPVDPD